MASAVIWRVTACHARRRIQTGGCSRIPERSSRPIGSSEGMQDTISCGSAEANGRNPRPWTWPRSTFPRWRQRLRNPPCAHDSSAPLVPEPFPERLSRHATRSCPWASGSGHCRSGGNMSDITQPLAGLIKSGLEPKDFRTGSKGFFASDKITTADGTRYQAQAQAILIGSKGNPKAKVQASTERGQGRSGSHDREGSARAGVQHRAHRLPGAGQDRGARAAFPGQRPGGPAVLRIINQAPGSRVSPGAVRRIAMPHPRIPDRRPFRVYARDPTPGCSSRRAHLLGRAPCPAGSPQDHPPARPAGRGAASCLTGRPCPGDGVLSPGRLAAHPRTCCGCAASRDQGSPRLTCAREHRT